jgi:hypothetical protein
VPLHLSNWNNSGAIGAEAIEAIEAEAILVQLELKQLV